MEGVRSYAVCWREGDGDVCLGKLELHEGHVDLEGQTADRTRTHVLSLARDEIASVTIGRALDERVRGLPSLIVERVGAAAVYVTSPLGVGAVQELASALGWSRGSGSRRPLSVVIVGGGVASLEAMVALRALAEERVSITVVSASPRFSYRPLEVARPFDGRPAPSLDLGELAAGCGAHLVVDEALSVDTAARTLATSRSGELPYDVLLVATGARPRAAVPGATTFWDREPFGHVLAELEAGSIERLVFAVPSGTVWPLPLYELALLTSKRLAEIGARGAKLAFVTSEDAPLALFGRDAGAAVAQLLAERDIELVAGHAPLRFEGGRLELAPQATVRADRVVALPQLVGTRLEGLPADDAGFLPVDPYGHVRGCVDVFAAGDATTLPVKQGGLATQQADAVAEAIAARAGAPVRPTPFRPVLRALLLTGEAPLFLRTQLAGGGSESAIVADEPLWWPAGKIAGRYLGPYLAARADRVGRDLVTIASEQRRAS